MIAYIEGNIFRHHKMKTNRTSALQDTETTEAHKYDLDGYLKNTTKISCSAPI